MNLASVYVDQAYVGEVLRFNSSTQRVAVMPPIAHIGRQLSDRYTPSFITEHRLQVELVLRLESGGASSLSAWFTTDPAYCRWRLEFPDERAQEFFAIIKQLTYRITDYLNEADVVLEAAGEVTTSLRGPQSRFERMFPAVEKRNSNLDAGLWKAKDGRVIPITEMETRHIRNCIARITRSETNWRKDWLPKFYAELARREQPTEEKIELPPIWKRDLDL